MRACKFDLCWYCSRANETKGPECNGGARANDGQTLGPLSVVDAYKFYLKELSQIFNIEYQSKT